VFEDETPEPIGAGLPITGELFLYLDIEPGDAADPAHSATIEVFMSDDAVTWIHIGRTDWKAGQVDRGGNLLTRAGFRTRSPQYQGKFLRAVLTIPDRMRCGYFLDYELA
jgi:hypothetical protein